MQIIFRVYDEQICCKVNDRNLKRAAAAAAAAAAADPCLCAVQISDITYEQARASYQEFEGGELGLREGYLVVGNQGHGGGLACDLQSYQCCSAAAAEAWCFSWFA